MFNLLVFIGYSIALIIISLLVGGLVCMAWRYVDRKTKPMICVPQVFVPELQQSGEISFEIECIDGKAPKYSKLPKNIRDVIGSKKKYDDAVSKSAICNSHQ